MPCRADALRQFDVSPTLVTDPSPDPASAPAPLLRVRGLRKHFGEHAVLRGIDLDVMPGDRIAILGASGSGKSTLLRCLNLMERPSAGVVELACQAIGRAAPDKAEAGERLYDEAELTRVCQRVGMVFQQFNLFPHMTAIGNVMEGLRIVRGLGKPEARERAQAELARVGLADKAQAYPARLSGGQKQRVAIARALAMDPEVLLFDEPTSALDPELVGEVLRVIRSLAEEGRTMLLVTHEIGFAYHFANRVLFLFEGVIHEQGTPDQVLKHPTQPRTRAFVERHREFDF
jgi:polar amino acid transport system ATP-binding protein